MTNDEDHRQDLWVYYLSGNPPSSFASHLEKIKSENSEHRELQDMFWRFINDDAYAKITELIGEFSEFEKSIIVMLVIGLDIPAISGYKGIQEVRIRQAIHVIRSHSKWQNL